jgi:hypothetical protein
MRRRDGQARHRLRIEAVSYFRQAVRNIREIDQKTTNDLFAEDGRAA